MQVCAHLGFQFNEFSGLERLKQAAMAGFTAAEWPGIYEFPRADFFAQVKQHQLTWPQVTLPLGRGNEKGIAALPGREAEFKADCALAIDYALQLGAKVLHPMAGVGAGDRQTYLNNLGHCLAQASTHNLQVMVEVLSPAAVPGYYLNSYDLAEDIIRELPGLQLLLDTYHADVLTGDVVGVIKRFAGRIAHVQVADNPGRHEPGTGHLDFAAIQTTLKQSGYEGYLGCEYKPATTTMAGLHQLKNRGWL